MLALYAFMGREGLLPVHGRLGCMHGTMPTLSAACGMRCTCQLPTTCKSKRILARECCVECKCHVGSGNGATAVRAEL